MNELKINLQAFRLDINQKFYLDCRYAMLAYLILYVFSIQFPLERF